MKKYLFIAGVFLLLAAASPAIAKKDSSNASSRSYVNGGGQIREDDYKISFGGNIEDTDEGYSGNWQINFHNTGNDSLDKARFHADKVSTVNFYEGNSNTCDEAMNMTLLGKLDGEEGYKVIFRAGDYGKGRGPESLDTVRVELYKDNSKIYDTHNADFTDESCCVGNARTGLDSGNIKIVF